MHRAVLQHAAGTDIVIMAAAVADYTPVSGVASRKLPREDDTLTLEFAKTPDILGELGRRRGDAPTPVLVGFAAETGEPETRGRQKLASKSVDMIVANDVSRTDAGFDLDVNAVTLLTTDGDEPLELQPKTELARLILDRVESILHSRSGAVQRTT
jgi:phosphopantothenoylcysteine decarboxylase/phosphopantothenate--cysteine ligase